jgi:hypothetical protein
MVHRGEAWSSGVRHGLLRGEVWSSGQSAWLLKGGPGFESPAQRPQNGVIQGG